MEKLELLKTLKQVLQNPTVVEELKARSKHVDIEEIERMLIECYEGKFSWLN